MRLRNFIMNAQKVTVLSGSAFECKSDATDGPLDTPVVPKLEKISLYQGATLEHTSPANSNSRFYNVIVSGTITRNNSWSGSFLKMTGSLNSHTGSVGTDPGIAFQVFMLADGEYAG